jgi:urea transport system permease protein
MSAAGTRHIVHYVMMSGFGVLFHLSYVDCGDSPPQSQIIRMNAINCIPLSRALGLVLASFFSAAVPAVADDDAEIYRQLLNLTDKDFEVRKAALEQLKQTRNPHLSSFLNSYQLGNIYRWRDRLILCETFSTDESEDKFAPLFDPLTGKPLMFERAHLIVAESELTSVTPPRRDRRLINGAVKVMGLFSSDEDERVAAARRVGDSRDAGGLPYLKEMLDSETIPGVKRTAQESIYLIQLAGDVPEQKAEKRLDSARQLGEMRSARGAAVLAELLQQIEEQESAGHEIDEAARSVFREAAEKIEQYQKMVRIAGYLFSGLSLGSILILMALGLSIIFGQMGVINMAHGELMMIGAYATYEMQQLFGHSVPDSPSNWYFVAAAPVAFLSAALVGYLIERLVVRHLYGRPLDTLLATWGVSVILIQIVRVRYGDNIGVNSPTWLVGSFEIIQDVVLPYNRCFILLLCASCVLLIYGLMNHTRSGLLVRATVQNREMSDALGVNTRRIDGYAFALGGGLAGIAGYALTLIGGVTPDMGQNYIVDSFLVVVTGGVGKLAGAVSAGFGIGTLNKLLEPTFEAVWSKVLILVFVMLFIQWRPTGLFPPKGRLADD